MKKYMKNILIFTVFRRKFLFPAKDLENDLIKTLSL